MNEYISKEYIRNIVLKRWSDSCGAECYAYGCVLDDIEDMPTVDVVEVVHGRWVYETSFPDSDVCNCSICDQIMQTAKGVRMNYCPNCGARMDLQ